MITVRIAHAEPRTRSLRDGEQPADPRVRGREVRLGGSLVVLADDAGHRALPAWLAEDPGTTSLPVLLGRPGDDTGTTAGIPEELAVTLVSAAGATVTGVELHQVAPDAQEVTAETFAALIELGGPPDATHVSARLDLGLALAAIASAPVRVADPVMDRLAVPVPDGDLLAPFLDRGSEAAGTGHGPVILDRRSGRVLRVAGARPRKHRADNWPGKRPRFEPRNMAFGDGLDRWELAGGPGEDAGSDPPDYSAAAEGQCAILSAAAAHPRGSAVLAQPVYADDFLGAAVTFRGEIRTEDATGRAGLCLEVVKTGWGINPDRRESHAVTMTGSQDWSRQEITVPVPGDAESIRFGILLAGPGRVWLRRPELRRAAPDGT